MIYDEIFVLNRFIVCNVLPWNSTVKICYRRIKVASIMSPFTACRLECPWEREPPGSPLSRNVMNPPVKLAREGVLEQMVAQQERIRIAQHEFRIRGNPILVSPVF